MPIGNSHLINCIDLSQGKRNINFLETEDDIEALKRNHSKEIENLRVQMRDEIKKYEKLKKKMTIMINPAKNMNESSQGDFAGRIFISLFFA